MDSTQEYKAELEHCGLPPKVLISDWGLGTRGRWPCLVDLLFVESCVRVEIPSDRQAQWHSKKRRLSGRLLITILRCMLNSGVIIQRSGCPIFQVFFRVRESISSHQSRNVSNNGLLRKVCSTNTSIGGRLECIKSPTEVHELSYLIWPQLISAVKMKHLG